MPNYSADTGPGATRSCSPTKPCERCLKDQAFLRRGRRPRAVSCDAEISAVDLFAGCGGMTLGLHEAARRAGYRLRVPLALDSDPAAICIYEANFPTAGVVAADIGGVFDGVVGTRPTVAEQEILQKIGRVDVLLGGPPCQGHSDLNNHTRRSDPKNALYLRMARAAEVLLPKVVVIENVATVHLDKGGVVQATSTALVACGYKVAAYVLDLRRVGVPQRRRRFVLVATTLASLNPAKILADLESSMPSHPDRTVRWASHDLMPMRASTAYDTASRVSAENAKRIDLLFDRKLYDLPNKFRPKCHRDKDHSYISMYGRLRWGRPAQTITTGFGSMGQGRYVHPQRRRTLTPHEAARLQTFPDWFDFGQDTPRGVLARVIGNAVPPLLMTELGAMIIPAIAAANEAQSEKLRKRA